MLLTDLEKTLNEDFNESITENGALGYKTTGKKLLDLNFAVSSLRSDDPKSIINFFKHAFYEDKELAIKWLFYLRDVREGLGERRSFRIILGNLAYTEPEIIKDLVKFIPFYGRYDDILCLIGTPCEDSAYEVIVSTLNADMANYTLNKPISLLAKWLPSENASSRESIVLAKKIRKKLALTSKEYRQILSRLRKYLDVVERKMCDGDWDNIVYSAVPSKANLLYKNAFLKHDGNRRREFLSKVEKGQEKINSGVVFPHDIVHSYSPYWYCYSFNKIEVKIDQALEEMWKALPNLVNGDSKTLVVADGSGSMTKKVSRESSLSALEVSNALAIYFAERASGEFKNSYITFGNKPQLVNLSNCNSLKEKLELAFSKDDCSNTNIEATFDLILQTAINGKMKQHEMPENILILSDMEFDQATYDNNDNEEKLFKTISKKYAEHGYKMPKLIFWNLCSRTNTIPLKENELGVVLVSGFSVNIVKMVMSSELDPYECLKKQLNSDRYSNITIKNI